MSNRRELIVGCLAVGLALTAATSGRAGNVARGDRATLSFSRSVALPGVTLAPGSYLFEIVDDAGGLDVVRVSNRATRVPHFQGFTTKVERPDRRRGHSAVTLGEAPPGEPAPIRVWYPADGSNGRQFLY